MHWSIYQSTLKRHAMDMSIHIVDRESTDFLVELPLMSAEVSTVTILVGYRPTTGGISVNYWQNVGGVSFDSRERVDR